MDFESIFAVYKDLEIAWSQSDRLKIEEILSAAKSKRSTLSSILQFVRGAHSKMNHLDALMALACVHGHIGLVEFLFSKGALFDVPCSRGATSFEIMASNNIEICRLFLKFDEDHQLKTDLSGPLVNACLSHQPEIVDLLIENGANPVTIDWEKVDLTFVRWPILDCLSKHGAKLPNYAEVFLAKEKAGFENKN